MQAIRSVWHIARNRLKDNKVRGKLKFKQGDFLRLERKDNEYADESRRYVCR